MLTSMRAAGNAPSEAAANACLAPVRGRSERKTVEWGVCRQARCVDSMGRCGMAVTVPVRTCCGVGTHPVRYGEMRR